MAYDFSVALSQLKQGQRVQRAGWNGKGMFLFMVHGSEWKCLSHYAEGLEGYNNGPFIMMATADKKLVPWLASQTDILSRDWSLVNG